MRLLIGTHNPSKLASMRARFAPEDGITCLSLDDLDIHVDIPEDAKDALGNARQKALIYHRASGLPVLAEDSGLVFLDLPDDHPDQPGIHVRRMQSGHVMEDDEEMLRWYQAIAHRHGGRLRAGWQDAYCIVLDEAHVYTMADDKASLPCVFDLVDRPCESRKPGWPLDSLSICPYNGRYFAEMTVEERQAAYHAHSDAAKLRHEAHDKWLREICLGAVQGASVSGVFSR